MHRSVLIAGGGITGLAAAYALRKRFGPDLLVTVVEREHRLGGQVQTEYVDGLILEEAPDSFLVRKPWFVQLCRELGLPLVDQNPAIRKTYIVKHGELVPLPAGMQLFVPTDIKAFVRSPLLSQGGKLRALLEPLMELRREATGDESIGHFVARRFGREMLAQIGAPLTSGVYGGNPYELSLQATFPQFLTLEREKGSLLKAIRRTAPAKGTTGSAFQAVSTGLGSVVEALVKASPGVDFRTGTAVAALSPAAGGGYDVALSTGEQLHADAVLLTVPANVAARLVEGLVPAVAAELEAIEYSSAAVVALAYDRADVPHPMDATGFLVPQAEGMPITGSTWVSSKWPHTAPPEKVLLRAYLTPSGDRDWMQEPDEAILAAVREALAQVMGLTAEPLLTRLYRWPRSRPRYKVGHLERVGRIEASMAGVQGLYLAGAAYRGLGLPDCVRSGQEAAERIAAQLA